MSHTPHFLLLLLVMATISVVGLTLFIRKKALAKGLIDIPNARSSHQLPTPRGGGLAIVLVFCIFLTLFGQGQLADYTLIGAVTLTSLIGMADDIKSRTATQRLSIHCLSAAMIVYAAKGLPPINFGFGEFNMGVAGYAVAAVGAVWMINLTNFMDGIDGLVASQVVIASAVASALILFTPMPEPLLLSTSLLGACTLGFLLLNLPPAKIFMGDVGSGTLGLIVSALMLTHTQQQPEWLYVWLILMGLLVVDASYTLMTRAVNKQRLFEGHRTHAYQKLALRWGSHRRVTFLEAAIQIFWLAPLACLVAEGNLPGFWAMLLAYTPLAFICIKVKAGTAHCN